MTVMTSVIPHGRPFTVDDLEGFPDDGNRYELIDGMLLVTPAQGVAAPGGGRRTAASYWILDPEEPGSLTAFELDGEGRFQQVARVEGDEEFATARPFPVTVVPARLLDGLHPRE
jgi:hypothetical protein